MLHLLVDSITPAEPLPTAKKIAESLVKPKTMHTFAAQSESSAVGSALRSGRRGRAFESPLADRAGAVLADCSSFFVPKGVQAEPRNVQAVVLNTQAVARNAQPVPEKNL